MNATVLYALTGAGLASMGLYGLIAGRHLLRRILSFNVIGGGIFLMFGALGSGATDPVPQAMIITGIVVALSATALAVALAVRLHGEAAALEPSDTGDGDG